MISINDQFDKIDEYFSPKVVGEVNDVYIKIAKINGDKIPWHNHKSEDEMFYIIDGELLFEDAVEGKFVMRKGDMHIVRRGVDHKVSATSECRIMLVENKKTAHTGDVDSDITKSINQQLK
jgi:quercetin dioxygenase-like cupin family protein